MMFIGGLRGQAEKPQEESIFNLAGKGDNYNEFAGLNLVKQ
jgi:hypothetical protein